MTHEIVTLPDYEAAYARGARPGDLMQQVFTRIEAAADPGIFLHLRPLDAVLEEAEALPPRSTGQPLWGIPFAVKDNIDVAGIPTTAGCPAFAYTPQADAFVVARLRAAGAIPIGKTNLDQFATGLNGMRTPFTPPRNALDPEIVPGGSSSGSAVAVARGIVPFALGTDTAGSGRVPAALNNIVGLKPTLGALSTRGVVPACRTLDSVSIFALTVADAHNVYRAAAGFDAADPYARPIDTPPPSRPPKLTVGVPNEASLVFDGDAAQARSFADTVAALAARGGHIRAIDLAPFDEVAQMLYAGPWVAERQIVIESLLSAAPDSVLPVIREVIGQADGLSAADAFRAQYRLKALKRTLAPVLDGVDLICVPSVPTFVSVAEIASDPIGANSRLGVYTNFVNLLDLCGLTVPVAPRCDGRPGSVTLLARKGRDGLLAALAGELETLGVRGLGATSTPAPRACRTAMAKAGEGEMEVVVCGAHMSGLPLNNELTARGGRFLRASETTPDYGFYALAGNPPRPGLVRRTDGQGGAIAVEVWALPEHAVGRFLDGIPAPLGLGTVRLADGTASKGFLCEAIACEGARDVTHLGSWRRVVEPVSVDLD